MTDTTEKQKASDNAEFFKGEGERIFGLGKDGMGTFTAKMEIDRKLRKELMESYDLIEVINKGRYYTAKAKSKDGDWLYDLLIDKQSSTIQIAGKKRSV